MDVSQVGNLSLEEGLDRYDVKLQEALSRLTNSGFYLPQAPSYANQMGIFTEYRGDIPADVTTLTGDQISWYMSMLASWTSYVGAKLAEADINAASTKEKLEFLIAKLSSALIGAKRGNKTLSNSGINSIVCCDPRYVEIQSKLIYYQASYKMLRAVAKSAEHNWETLSRRITQNGQELDRGRRSPTGNIPTGPMFGRGTR